MNKLAVLSMLCGPNGAGDMEWEMLTLPILSLPSQCDQIWGSHTPGHLPALKEK